MKQIFISVLLLGALMFGLSISAQTPGITNHADVSVEHELMRTNDALLRQHKDKYKYGNAKIETWIDGKTYIVASKKGKYSLFSIDGTPLLVIDGTVQWYEDISVRKAALCSVFILYGGKDRGFRKGIASDTFGIVTAPDDNAGGYFEVMDLDGEIFVRTASNKQSMSHWPSSCALYSVRSGKIFGNRDWAKNFIYARSMAEGTDSMSFDGSNISIWHGPRKETFIVTKYDRRSGEYDYHSEFTDPDGKKTEHRGYYMDFVPGYGLLSPLNRIQTSVNPECNVPTLTASLGYPTRSLSLVTTDGSLLLDSISEISATGIDGIFIYRKVIDEELYTGLTNFKNHHDDIAPRFSDIYVETAGEEWSPFIRTTLLAKAEKYDPTKTYTRNFTGLLDRSLEYASADSILKIASRTDIDTLSETDLIALSRGILRKYASYADTQQYVLRNYEKGTATFDDEKLYNQVVRFFDRVNPRDFSAESSLMFRTLERLRDLDAQLAEELALKNDIILGDLIFTRDSIIPAKKQAWLDRSTEVKTEIEEFRRAQEQKKQAEKAARIKAWADAAKQWADAYNAKQTAETAKKRAAAKTARTAVKGSRALNTAATAPTDNTSDRKAFLKGQIIDWKNKLQKAEASYQQAVSSGGDNWEKERVIESKRNTVNECLEMIRQYESELNSL